MLLQRAARFPITSSIGRGGTALPAVYAVPKYVVIMARSWDHRRQIQPPKCAIFESIFVGAECVYRGVRTFVLLAQLFSFEVSNRAQRVLLLLFDKITFVVEVLRGRRHLVVSVDVLEACERRSRPLKIVLAFEGVAYYIVLAHTGGGAVLVEERVPVCRGRECGTLLGLDEGGMPIVVDLLRAVRTGSRYRLWRRPRHFALIYSCNRERGGAPRVVHIVEGHSVVSRSWG